MNEMKQSWVERENTKKKKKKKKKKRKETAETQ